MNVSFIPAPHERAYYEGLFRAADASGAGSINGAQAVQFFGRAKLPTPVLKNIWTVADQPSTSSLDLKKFAVAVRLIQLTQNGQKGQGSNLAVAEGVELRPVMFEGVSGVSVPLPQQQGASGAPPPTPSQQQRPPAQPGQQQLPPQQQQPPAPTPGQMPPPQQQQQMAPPTPMRPGTGMPPPTPQTASRALTAQDPYSMTPQERSRYEDLFPQYAKPDGYIYGSEAVSLFMKSGVDQGVLRDIWNMVDRPVDNRLDKLEFAMAMHLIVCISKKNLPSPKGGLPNSLKALKAAQPPPPGQQAPAAQPDASSQVSSPPGPQGMPGPGMGQMPAPSMGQMGPPASPTRGSIPAPSGPGSLSMQPAPSFEQQPPQQTQHIPPVVQTGGMSISDAFEGLSTTSADVNPSPSGNAAPSLPSYVPEQPAHTFAATNITEAVPEEPTPAPTPSYQNAAPTAFSQAAKPQVPETPTHSSKALASNYDMGDAHQELSKLKDVLQKLQAENISLKAQLGNMSEEEKDVQKELGAVVAEIGSLSNELHTLRASVLAAKSRLLEASAELKAAHEQKGVLNDLMGEARETKTAIDNATSAMQSASEGAHHVEQQKEHAVKQSDMFESNLFEYNSSAPAGGMPPSAAPAGLTPAQARPEAMPAPTMAGNALPTPGLGDMYRQPPTQQPAPSIPMVQTVSSEDDDGGVPPQPVNQNATEMFTNEYNQPPPPQASAPPTPQHHQPPAQSAAAQPTPTLDRPSALGSANHPRQISQGFNSDFVMGGSAEPLPDAPESGISPAARTASSSADFGYDEEAFKIVEDLKSKANMASETARDAEAAQNRLAAEADELRNDADKADATARSLKAAANEKKKGRFGRGGDKKKLLRDAERAAQDAQDIRKRFLTVQGQAKDASAVAMETKREADKLREDAEKAEMDMAAAASMRDQNKSADTAQPAQPKAPQMSPPNDANGYGGGQQAPAQFAGGYGQPPAPMGAPGGFGQPPAPQGAPGGYGQPPGPQSAPGGYGQPPVPQSAPGGYGQPPVPQDANAGFGQAPPPTQEYNQMSPPSMDGGFGMGVMGSGGGNATFDLPSPNQLGPLAGGGDPYAAAS